MAWEMADKGVGCMRVGQDNQHGFFLTFHNKLFAFILGHSFPVIRIAEAGDEN